MDIYSPIDLGIVRPESAYVLLLQLYICYILHLLVALAGWVMRVVQSFLSPIVQSFPFFSSGAGLSGQSRERECVCVSTVTYVSVGLIGKNWELRLSDSWVFDRGVLFPTLQYPTNNTLGLNIHSCTSNGPVIVWILLYDSYPYLTAITVLKDSTFTAWMHRS